MSVIKHTPPTFSFFRKYLPDLDAVEIGGKLTLTLSMFIGKAELNVYNLNKEEEEEIEKIVTKKLREYFITTAEQLKRETNDDTNT